MEVSSQLQAPAALSLGTNSVVIEQEAGWVTQQVWTFRRKVSCTEEMEPRTVQSSHYID